MSDWRRYMDGDEGRWLFREERLLHRDGCSVAAALRRDPWQRPIFKIFDDPRTKLGYVDACRGFGKTSIAAALAVERLFLRRDHSTFVVAADRDQARILLAEARGFVSRDPVLRKICVPRRDWIENKLNGSTLEVLSSDAASNYGYGARQFTVLFDEFWAQPSRDTWDAFWSAVPKFRGSQAFVLTNAGVDKDGVAWKIREQCRTSGDPALQFWASADHDVIPSWIDPEEIELQRRTLPRTVFSRLWEGKWGEGSGDFLLREEIEACIDEKLDPNTLMFDTHRRYYLGIDLGLRHDRSVIAVVHKERETVIVDHLRTWFGSPEHPVSLEDVQAHLHRLGKCIPRIRRGYLDPWQGLLMLERAKRAGMRTIEEFTFSPSNIQLLSQTLWNVFKTGSIRIPPHALLIDELVTLRIIEKRYGWRIDHQAGGFSDHAIALGLALVAAIPETGEIAGDDRRLQYFYDEFAPGVHARMFGLGKRSGLTMVGYQQRKMNDYASIRFLQTLRAMDRISVQEASVIEQQIRDAIWRNRDATRALGCISDGYDDELGSLHDFLHPPAKTPKPTTEGVTQ